MPWATQEAERRPVEQRRGQHVQRVEPAAGLAVVLDDEVARVVVLEPLGVLERVVHLRERHGARLEPAVQHLRHPAHRRATGRVVRVGPGEVVDEGPVQVGGPHAEVALQLVERAVDVRARVGRVVAHPHRDRRAPVAVAGDRPVDRVLQPLAELAVLDVRGHPGDLAVQLDHPVAERRDLHEPRVHRPLDERVAAAPAVRVRVVVGLVAQERAEHERLRALLEVADDLVVGVEDEHALVRGHGGVERAVGADRHDHLDARRVRDDLVLLTERGRDVDEAGAVLGGDVVGGEHAVGVRPADEEVERRRVGQRRAARSRGRSAARSAPRPAHGRTRRTRAAART